MSSLRKSFLFTFGQKYSELIIAFTSNIILARLLSPEEVGLFSIVAAMTLLAHMFRDFGVSTYIIQEKNLTDSRLRSAQSVTMFNSFLIGILLFLFHEQIADFFERPEVSHIIIFSAINFFLIPFGSISLSLLRREMNFKVLFIIVVSSALVHAISSISLAYAGFSYMSLAWASLLGTLTSVLLAMIYNPKAFFIIPGFTGIKGVFKFGSTASLISLISQLGNILPEMIIGKFYGMSNVGLFSRASGVIRLFHMGIIQGILPVILPHYVNTIKQGSNLKKDFFKISVAINCISWPFFSFVALSSESILLFLFGDQWVGAAPLLQLLTIAAMFNNTFILAGNVFVAYNSIHLQLRVSLVSHTIGFLLIVLASTQSLSLILVAIILFRATNLITTVYYLKKIISFSYPEVIFLFLKPLYVTMLSIFPLVCLYFWYPSNENNWLYHLLISSLLTAIFWGLANFIFTTPIADEVKHLIRSN